MGTEFERVVGQERVKKQLLSAWRSGRMAHAMLITGPEGCGKDAVAFELARVLNCMEDEDGACGMCSSCRRISLLQHTNLSYLFALPGGSSHSDDPLHGLSQSVIEAVHSELEIKAGNLYHHMNIPGANVIKISSIREAKKNASFSTGEKGRKVIIISMAERMDAPGTNSLLKLLEEPPKNTYLFLTTSQPKTLPATIRSRCQEVKLDRLRDSQVIEQLIALGQKEEMAIMLAAAAEGDLGRAIELTDKSEYELRAGLAEGIEKAVSSGNNSEISRLNSEVLTVSRGGKSVLKEVLKISGKGMTDSLTEAGMSRRKALEVAECFDKAVDLLRRNVYIPSIFSSLVFEVRELIEGERIADGRNPDG